MLVLVTPKAPGNLKPMSATLAIMQRARWFTCWPEGTLKFGLRVDQSMREDADSRKRCSGLRNRPSKPFAVLGVPATSCGATGLLSNQP